MTTHNTHRWNRSRPLVVLLALLLLGTAVPAQQAINSLCPVLTDEVIDPEITTQYQGNTIGLCCQKCRRDFEADPSAYAAALEGLLGMQDDSSDEHDSSDDHHEAGQPTDDGSPANAGAATDAGEIPSTGGGHDHEHVADEDAPGIFDLAGRLHPIVIHFPIALIMAAALSELLMMLRPNRVRGEVGRFCIDLGAAGALVAATLGWMRASQMQLPSIYTDTIFLHRWSGVTVAVLALATAILSRHVVRTERRAPYRAMLLLTTIAVGMAGHLGASLVYGLDYFA